MRSREAAVRRDLQESGPDPRIWGRKYRGSGPVPLGIAVMLLAAALSYLAFAKQIPFTDPGYELSATFDNAATLRASSPVRIAGIKVGEVTAVEPRGDAAEITFTVSDEGQPVHEDASVEIRPRLFLEGNFFLDLRPGSASAPALPDGGSIPVTQTATAVQLDEVLAALQSDPRTNLRRLLEGYGTALTYQPVAADDADQEPVSRGRTGAEALQQALHYGGRAGRGTAIVSDALRGVDPHDLSGLIEAQRDVFAELAGHESQLQGLISNLNTTAGALAAEQSNLSASIRELAPTLEEAQPSLLHLNDSLPPLRALAIALEPGIAELPDTIDAAGPWLEQTGLLLRDRELGGLARLLARAAPDTAALADTSLDLFGELTDLGRCVSEVLDPALESRITVDPLNPLPANQQPNYLEFLYAAVNAAGEGQDFDGNGQFLRIQAGAGGELVSTPNPAPTPTNTLLFGNAIDGSISTQPRLSTSGPPPFRTGVPCHRNALPDLNGAAATVAPGTPQAVGP